MTYLELLEKIEELAEADVIDKTDEVDFDLLVEDEDDWEESWNLDEGFDPYMGEYTWDC